MPRASVCMATYNGALYLREQLESILSQLGPNDDLIISDDHSTDDTMHILACYTDAKIKVISNPGKRGHVQNFVNAMSHATGDFIALSDQDDVWAAGRLGRMLQTISRMPRYSLVVGDLMEFDEYGCVADQTALGPAPANRVAGLFRIFLGQAKYFGSTFMLSRDLMRFILPIPSYIEAHDLWIAMHATIRGEVAHLQETTLMRRLHGSNLSPQSRRSLVKVLRSRACYFVGLMQSSCR